MTVNNISVPQNYCRDAVYEMQTDNQHFMSIGRGSCIVKADVISGLSHNLHIGQFCTTGDNVRFMFPVTADHSRISTSSDRLVALLPGEVLNSPRRIKGQIIVGNDVWIGDSVTIMAGAVIGSGAVIKANAVVESCIPPYAVVSGNPAVVTGYRFTEDQIRSMLDISWWDWSDDVLIDRKPDFAFPINEFIEKYRVDDDKTHSKTQHTKKTILLFPDIGYADSLWERVMREYCEMCAAGIEMGQLNIRLPDNEKADKSIAELQNVFNEYNDDIGDIVVTVGDDEEDAEIFGSADFYVTTRESGTAHHCSLAEKFGVRIISGADMPDVFGEIIQ